MHQRDQPKERVLARLDADALDAAIGGWVADSPSAPSRPRSWPPSPGPLGAGETPGGPAEHRAPGPRTGCCPAAAVDGKALRGARTPEGGQVFLVAAIDHATGAVSGQRQVPSSASQRHRRPPRDLLTSLQAPGMVWTLDARCTPPRPLPRLITQDLHGHYLLIIKGDRARGPAGDAATALLTTRTDWVATTATEADPRPAPRSKLRRAHPRRPPANDPTYPRHRPALARLRRDTSGLDGFWTGKGIVYGITSLPADLAGPARLNHYEQHHSLVEEPSSHWVRDVTFSEDNPQVRTGTAPTSARRPPRPDGQRPLRLAGRANIAHARRDLHNHNQSTFAAPRI